MPRAHSGRSDWAETRARISTPPSLASRSISAALSGCVTTSQPTVSGTSMGEAAASANSPPNRISPFRPPSSSGPQMVSTGGYRPLPSSTSEPSRPTTKADPLFERERSDRSALAMVAESPVATASRNPKSRDRTSAEPSIWRARRSRISSTTFAFALRFPEAAFSPKRSMLWLTRSMTTAMTAANRMVNSTAMRSRSVPKRKFGTRPKRALVISE